MTKPLIKINYNFGDDISDGLKHDFQTRYVPENLENKMDSYLEYIGSQSPSVELLINITLRKDKHDKFEGRFLFDIPGRGDFVFERIYDDPLDLVNHAFDHFKLKLSDKKKNHF